MDKAVRIAVCGAAGRMGGHVIRVLAETPGVRLTAALERPGHPLLGEDAGYTAGLGSLGVRFEPDLAAALARGVDAAIDFTSPAATLANAEICGKARVSLVAGTTGLSAEQRAEFARCAAATPMVHAPNMSLGVNLLFKLAEMAARVLGPSYDAEIVELHHNRKKDAPSGTALRLAEAVASGQGKPLAGRVVTGREGMVGERKPDEVGVLAVRAGDIVGDHILYLAGPGERLELCHRAHTRENFARGAVRAALWVPGKAPGLYDMMDVLGLKG